MIFPAEHPNKFPTPEHPKNLKAENTCTSYIKWPYSENDFVAIKLAVFNNIHSFSNLPCNKNRTAALQNANTSTVTVWLITEHQLISCFCQKDHKLNLTETPVDFTCYLQCQTVAHWHNSFKLIPTLSQLLSQVPYCQISNIFLWASEGREQKINDNTVEKIGHGFVNTMGCFTLVQWRKIILTLGLHSSSIRIFHNKPRASCWTQITAGNPAAQWGKAATAFEKVPFIALGKHQEEQE